MREMKQSGIAWLGQVPKEWKENRLKYCFSQHQTGAWGEEFSTTLKQCSCVRVADFDYDNGISIKDKELTQRYTNTDSSCC